jgi:hypothetical protein
MLDKSDSTFHKFRYENYSKFKDEIIHSLENIKLTSEQIESFTTLVQYDTSMNEIRCPITWDAFEIGQNVLEINNCRHIFGQNALMEWFQNHSICPVCRTNVTQLRTNETSPQAQQTQPHTMTEGSLLVFFFPLSV